MTDDYMPRARGPEDYAGFVNRTVLDLMGRRRELAAALEECDESDARRDIRAELADVERSVKAVARLRRWT